MRQPPRAISEKRIWNTYVAPPEEEHAVGTFRRKGVFVGFGNGFVMFHENRIQTEGKGCFLLRKIIALENIPEKIRDGGQHGFHLIVLFGHAAVDVGNFRLDSRNRLVEIERGSHRIELRFEGIGQPTQNHRIGGHEALDFRQGVGVAVDERKLGMHKLRDGPQQIGGRSAESLIFDELLFEEVEIRTPAEFVQFPFELLHGGGGVRTAGNGRNVERVDPHCLGTEIPRLAIPCEFTQIGTGHLETGGLKEGQDAGIILFPAEGDRRTSQRQPVVFPAQFLHMNHGMFLVLNL